jgi:hypothetical protein
MKAGDPRKNSQEKRKKTAVVDEMFTALVRAEAMCQSVGQRINSPSLYFPAKIRPQLNQGVDFFR